ncbi:hypothetical protein CSOJ01_07024 [Colletotrichum sojae]|uniref:Uncharacterized protein n=1 Tax=Colletotrichum sojae TaxID=2175907 RepID=A0A8H6JAX1_9PEZI|nr:hypothetical protein CSOJ01_07024 [Colletotrichum sojae]
MDVTERQDRITCAEVRLDPYQSSSEGAAPRNSAAPREKKKPGGMKSLSTWALIKHPSPVQKISGSRLVMLFLAASERHGKVGVEMGVAPARRALEAKVTKLFANPRGTHPRKTGGTGDETDINPQKKYSLENRLLSVRKDITENGKEEEQKKRSANTLIAVPYLDEALARRDAAASVSMKACSIATSTATCRETVHPPTHTTVLPARPDSEQQQ